jgi:hypothetical protein
MLFRRFWNLPLRKMAPYLLFPSPAVSARRGGTLLQLSRGFGTRADLSGADCHPTDAILERSCASWEFLSSLNLSKCHGVTVEGLAEVASACEMLGELDLSYCKLRADPVADVLKTMLQRPYNDHSRPLVALKLTGALVLPETGGMNRLVRRVLFDQADNPDGPVLEELRISKASGLGPRPLTDICDASVAAGRPMLRALRILDIDGSGPRFSVYHKTNIRRLQFSAPGLEFLDISTKTAVVDSGAASRRRGPAGLPQALLLQRQRDWMP